MISVTIVVAMYDIIKNNNMTLTQRRVRVCVCVAIVYT